MLLLLQWLDLLRSARFQARSNENRSLDQGSHKQALVLPAPPALPCPPALQTVTGRCCRRPPGWVSLEQVGR